MKHIAKDLLIYLCLLVMLAIWWYGAYALIRDMFF